MNSHPDEAEQILAHPGPTVQPQPDTTPDPQLSGGCLGPVLGPVQRLSFGKLKFEQNKINEIIENKNVTARTARRQLTREFEEQEQAQIRPQNPPAQGLVGEAVIPGTSDDIPAVEQTDISEPVETNSGDSLSNPAVLSDEREPCEATELEAPSDALADLPEPVETDGRHDLCDPEVQEQGALYDLTNPVTFDASPYRFDPRAIEQIVRESGRVSSNMTTVGSISLRSLETSI